MDFSFFLPIIYQPMPYSWRLNDEGSGMMGCMYVVVVRGQRFVRVLGKGSQAVWEGGGIDGPVLHVGRELPAAVQLDGQGRDKIGWGRGGWGVKVCGHVRGCVKPGWGFL